MSRSFLRGCTGPERGERVPLFNGKNLDGRTPKLTGYELGNNHADASRAV